MRWLLPAALLDERHFNASRTISSAAATAGFILLPPVGSPEWFGYVRAFIAASSPANTSGTYSLQLSGFPPKRLEDEAQVIGDGLANSVIIQR